VRHLWSPFLSPPGNNYIQATILFLPAYPRKTWERKGHEGRAQLLKEEGKGEPGRHGHTSGFSVQQKGLYSVLATTSSRRHFPLNREKMHPETVSLVRINDFFLSKNDNQNLRWSDLCSLENMKFSMC